MFLVNLSDIVGNNFIHVVRPRDVQCLSGILCHIPVMKPLHTPLTNVASLMTHFDRHPIPLQLERTYHLPLLKNQ